MKFTLEDLDLKIKLITLYIFLSNIYDFSSITGPRKVFKHKYHLYFQKQYREASVLWLWSWGGSAKYIV